MIRSDGDRRRRSGRQQQALASVHLLGRLIIGDRGQAGPSSPRRGSAARRSPTRRGSRAGRRPARRRTAASLGKIPTTSAPALDLLVDPLERVGAPDLLPVGEREGGEGASRPPGPRRASPPRPGSPARAWSRPRRAARGRRPASGWAQIVRTSGEDHLGAALRDAGEDVAQEVDPAALPGGAEEHRRDGALEALVGVADDEADARRGRAPAGCAGRPSRRRRPRCRRPRAQDLPVARARSPRWR